MPRLHETPLGIMAWALEGWFGWLATAFLCAVGGGWLGLSVGARQFATAMDALGLVLFAPVWAFVSWWFMIGLGITCAMVLIAGLSESLFLRLGSAGTLFVLWLALGYRLAVAF